MRYCIASDVDCLIYTLSI